MIILSHRGLGFEKEENSPESYIEALRNGFSLEIDVQKTKDDVLVISHDGNLKRVKGIDKKITESQFAEVSSLIPSIIDVCYFIQDCLQQGQIIAIHVKDEFQGNIIELLAETLTKYFLEDKVIVFDLTKQGAEKIKSINPRIKVGISVGDKKPLDSIYFWQDLENFEYYDMVWWDEWHSGLYTKENAGKIRNAGKINYVVSPELHKNENHPKSKNLNDIKSVWKNLIEMNVDGICTDHPRELKEMLNNFKS